MCLDAGTAKPGQSAAVRISTTRPATAPYRLIRAAIRSTILFIIKSAAKSPWRRPSGIVKIGRLVHSFTTKDTKDTEDRPVQEFPALCPSCPLLLPKHQMSIFFTGPFPQDREPREPYHD